MPEIIKASLQKIKLIFLFGIFLFPVLPYAYLSSVLIILILFSFFDFQINGKNTKEFLIQSAFYWVLILSLLYTSNLGEGTREIQRTIALGILPFALFFSYKKQILRHHLLLQVSYIFANLILIGIIYSFLIKGMAKDRMPALPDMSFFEQLKFLWSYPYEFVREKSIHRLGSSWFINHKTLLAFNFLTASVFSINLLFKRQVYLLFKPLLVIVLTVFILCILYTQSLINVSLLFLLPLYIVFLIKSQVFKVVFIFVLFLIGVFMFQKLDLKNTYSNRNTEAVINLWKSVKKGEINANSDSRLYINYCSFERIRESPLFGFGVGDVQEQLNYCYKKHNFEPNIKKERIFNSHNYYTHLWLAGGVFCVFFFIILLLYNGIKSIKFKHFAYTSILIIIVVNLLFDNILLRYSGAVYFGLINTFLFITLKTYNNG